MNFAKKKINILILVPSQNVFNNENTLNNINRNNLFQTKNPIWNENESIFNDEAPPMPIHLQDVYPLEVFSHFFWFLSKKGKRKEKLKVEKTK